MQSVKAQQKQVFIHLSEARQVATAFILHPILEAHRHSIIALGQLQLHVQHRMYPV
jgi:hypothetical protein